MRCRSCDYPLRHLPEHRCPECGRGFDPADPATFNPEPVPFKPPVWLLTLQAAACLGLVVLAMISQTPLGRWCCALLAWINGFLFVTLFRERRKQNAAAKPR
jgi:hypothetical protein